MGVIESDLLTPSERDNPKAYQRFKAQFVGDLEAAWGVGWEQDGLQPDEVVTADIDLDQGARARRSKEMFLAGFLASSFSQITIPGGRIRIVTETEDAARKQIFTEVLSGWGEVVSRQTLLRADVEVDELNFLARLNDSNAVDAIVGDKQDFASYFTGLWAARDFMPSFRLPGHIPEEAVIGAFKEYYRPGLVRLGKLVRGRRALSIADPKATMAALVLTESIASLPFVDKLSRFVPSKERLQSLLDESWKQQADGQGVLPLRSLSFQGEVRVNS